VSERAIRAVSVVSRGEQAGVMLWRWAAAELHAGLTRLRAAQLLFFTLILGFCKIDFRF